jgi:hypothetical protein
VQLWRHQTPVGRFLKPMMNPGAVSPAHPLPQLWQDIGDRLACIKAGQMLRERRPRTTDSQGGAQRFTIAARPAVVTPPFGEAQELQDF